MTMKEMLKTQVLIAACSLSIRLLSQEFLLEWARERIFFLRSLVL